MEVIYAVEKWGKKSQLKFTLQFIKRLQVKRGHLFPKIDDLVKDYLEDYGYTTIKRVE
jgi:adenine specific DNA methylase Mod